MIVVAVLDKKFARYKRSVVKTARKLMRRFQKGGFYLEITLVNSRTMPKNVLSFPPLPGFPRPDLPDYRTGRSVGKAGIRQKSLGEIYLNPTVITKQGWSVEYMLIHGFLHLLGYDHKKERDRIVMETLEQKLLKEIPRSK